MFILSIRNLERIYIYVYDNNAYKRLLDYRNMLNIACLFKIKAIY